MFRNADGGNINISGLLEVINAERFINNANITAEILSITTDEFFNNHNGSTQLGNIVVTDIFSLSTPNASYTNTGTVASDSLSLTIGGDFDYVADYLNNGTITTNALNLNVGGDFSYDDSANDFDWGANDTLTVSGSAFFNVDDFYNYGKIDVANDFNVTAGDDFSNRATINTDSFNVTTDNFYNYDNATISADTVTIEVTNFNDDIDNTGTVSSDSLNFILTDSFTRSSTSFSGFTNFNNLGIITDNSFIMRLTLP